MESDGIVQELAHRQERWNLLFQRGGPKKVSPAILHDLGIYGGAQGIWVDKARTGKLAENGNGVTVSLTHSGKSYPDDWSEDGVIYHYPDTHRSPGRDVSEIEATKNAGRLGLPVFVITHTSHSKRDVYVGWITGWDDLSKQFLVLFDNAFALKSTAAREILEEINNEDSFALFQQEQGAKRMVIGRKNQQRFKFQVFKRYGPKCAVCGLEIPTLLQAAHLVPKERQGSDDPRNGLVFCANHHLAFDANLFGIMPGTLELCFKPSGPDAKTLQIYFKDLCYLAHPPREEALRWRYSYWVQNNHSLVGHSL